VVGIPYVSAVYDSRNGRRDSASLSFCGRKPDKMIIDVAGGAQGQTTIDFGSFPGAPDASVVITGQTGILTNSRVTAWIAPVATSDHSIAEHYIDAPWIIAGDIAAGTGFTIRGFASPTGIPRAYGQWTVNWKWA
jgi:hypothetical protein